MYQVKNFAENLAGSQKAQIVESHRRIRDYANGRGWVIDKWYLTIPLDPTPENTEWFEEMAKAADFPCEWRGLAHIEGWAARYPDVVDYYLEGGRARLAEDLARFSAISTIAVAGGPAFTVDDYSNLNPGMLHGQLAALRDALNSRDPHFLYDIAISHKPQWPAPRAEGYPRLVASTSRQLGDSHVAFHVMARGAESLQERPITWTGAIAAEAGSVEAQELEEFRVYGRPPSMPLEIKNLSVDLPGGLGHEFESGRLTLLQPDGGENAFDRKMSIVSPEDELKAEVIVTMNPPVTNHDDTGVYNHGSDSSGFLTIETLARLGDKGFDITIRLGVDDPSGYYPDQVEQPLAFLQHFSPPNRLRLAMLRGNSAVLQEIPQTSKDDDSARWHDLVLRYARALMAIQPYVSVELRMPDLADEDIRDINGVLRAARLVSGEAVTISWERLPFTFHEGVEVPAGPHAVAFQYMLRASVGDRAHDLGWVSATAQAAEVSSVQTDENGVVTA
ncbi:hypothetical protein, partial [Micromonospora sp. WMMD736]|uniref:hypothetical protein n=1 Tax=Micromonospora sp. WMMD736 TaxID=3404112 RepID=UPI003B9411A1